MKRDRRQSQVSSDKVHFISSSIKTRRLQNKNIPSYSAKGHDDSQVAGFVMHRVTDTPRDSTHIQSCAQEYKQHLCSYIKKQATVQYKTPRRNKHAHVQKVSTETLSRNIQVSGQHTSHSGSVPITIRELCVCLCFSHWCIWCNV